MSDGSSKLIAIDEETDHEIVYGRRFGKTDRATHEPLDPRAQIDVLTFDLLGLGAPPIGVKARDAKRFEQFLQLKQHLVFAPSKDIR
jgi:hypothetical protein